ncbi:hypothetical protein COY90_01670 [Candidatus Roizmanbacteria bacterium CG_4_10_14_0_8_um_filter_39_9]|uniref:Glycosyltransferase 2-like domain-containing protein n=1 Tax=Candidatus Roizmanbacteria bacterium CG_4_10_14_0_8_um_filter_39_9 TaxID=1974829 RepID=A0A2M7QEB4_9BACT|nr:MAG: hypothetical protein COY90_01670 [Candidatus Roizmanbacteria bacterium CG_4_10_14_0_8_um_filter_39_9]
MQPLVSVLICSYNAERFIESTLKSVLNQTYKNIEILILDNASTDKTVSIIQSLTHPNAAIPTSQVRIGPSIRLIQGEKNRGAYPGLNFLLAEAKGKFIAINDHDDIWHPEKLKRQINFLQKNIKYIGCGSSIINRYEAYDKYIFRSQPEDAKVAWHTSLMFRNNGYRYDTSIKVATDFYFIKNILCGNDSSIYNFQEPLVLRRIFKGTGNLSGQWMKTVSFKDIFKLKIGLPDKLALLNRSLLPQEWVEWVAMKGLGNNMPSKYSSYLKDMKNAM